ncbi:MAG: hypothetical protein PHS80_12805 [Methanothrix sp.]|nr:hypothetical protein [Methanothrix sp.]MDD4446403.1 hypothetical protein [Methanothrix sp.]
MRHYVVGIGSALILLLLTASVSWATQWDFNPDQVSVKHKHDMTSDVSGTGYSMEYMKVNTNNLSMLEYAHGSGTMDYADILNSEQKSTVSSDNYYWMIDLTTGQWVKKQAAANSVITYTKQYDNIQSPVAFAYGTGWYASHPVGYNSLLKDKNEAKSYQEAASMHRQVEYARALKGDIAIEINCTGPNDVADGKGFLKMKIDDDVTQGTLHIGELMANPKLIKTKYASVPNKINKTTGKVESYSDLLSYGHFEAWKDPIIEIDSNYVGDFHVQKTMTLDIKKSKSTWGEDWLPCCSGGFFDIPSKNFDKDFGSQKGIFDCTCRNTSISTMKPAWNASMAQFPTEKYKKIP